MIGGFCLRSVPGIGSERHHPRTLLKRTPEKHVLRVVYKPRSYIEIDFGTVFLDQTTRESPIWAILRGCLYTKDATGVNSGDQMRFVRGREGSDVGEITHLHSPLLLKQPHTRED